MEYAVCLAKKGETRRSYTIIEAAMGANVFYHSREYRFEINLCWCSKLRFSVQVFGF